MGRQFAVPFTGTLLAAGGNIDLWEIAPAEGYPIVLSGIRLGRLGETAESGRRVTILRLLAPLTPGSGGNAGEVVSTEKRLGQPRFDAQVNNPVVASGDTDEYIDELAWNTRVGQEFACNVKVSYPDRVVVRLQESHDEYEPDWVFAGTAVVEEAYGGLN